MRYGLIADLHANLQALETCAASMKQFGVEKLLCLGDLVGYGASPFEVVRAVMERAEVVAIAGEHERKLCGKPTAELNEVAVQILEWTAEQISPRQMQWLRGLADGEVVDGQLLLTHASLALRDHGVTTGPEMAENLEILRTEFPEQRICFLGHTHVPLIVGHKAIVKNIPETKAFQLDRNDVYLINPGSVGHPRNGVSHASYGVFDSEAWTFTIVRVPYDLRGAKLALTENLLPDTL